MAIGLRDEGVREGDTRRSREVSQATAGGDGGDNSVRENRRRRKAGRKRERAAESKQRRDTSERVSLTGQRAAFLHLTYLPMTASGA